MSKFFDVTLRTTAKGLPTILAALDGAADLIEVRQVSGQPSGPSRTRPAQVKSKAVGQTGQQVLDEFLSGLSKGSAFTLQRMASIFKTKGFNPKSASPCLSVAKAAGKIRQIGSGSYEKA